MELVLRCLLLLDVLGVKVLDDCGITPTSDADEERWTRRAGRGCPERGLPYNRTIRCPEAETPKSYIGLDIYIYIYIYHTYRPVSPAVPKANKISTVYS